MRLGGFLFLCAAASPSSADEAGDSSAANAEAPDFVPDAEPESRAVERFRVPIARDRVYKESPKEAGPTRVWIVSFLDLTCTPCRKHVVQLLTLASRHKKPLPVEIQFRMLPLGVSSRAVANAIVNARRFGAAHKLLAALTREGSSGPLALIRTFVDPDGLNISHFERLIASQSHRNEVDADIDIAKTFGVVSAPTFFVNGRRFSGLQSDEALDAIVSHEIAAASRVAAGRAGASDLYAVITENAKAQASGPTRPRFDDVKATELRPGASPSRGAAGAPVLVTVFSDLYCPHGAEHAATLRKLLDEFGGKIRIVYKHRPLTVYAASRTAACATIAAQEQAKFWEMHDKIVLGLALGHAREDGEAAGEQKIPRRLPGYAAEIKLDIDAFRLVMEGERCQKEIDADLALAAKLGVTGTPTTFVNGRRIVGAAPIDAYRRAIEDELKKVKTWGSRSVNRRSPFPPRAQATGFRADSGGNKGK